MPCLRLSGRLTLPDGKALWLRLTAAVQQGAKRIDLSEVQRIDGAAAALLIAATGVPGTINMLAMSAVRYMHRYGMTEEDMAYVTVKNRRQASLNPKAHLRKPATLDEVLESRRISWPIKLMDCCPQSSGGAAMVLASEQFIRDNRLDAVWITGLACRAVRDNPEAAAAMGVDPRRTRVMAYVITSALAGTAGIVYAFVDNTVNPVIFGLENAFLLLFMVIIGGMGSIMGSFFGAAFIVILPIFLNQFLPALGEVFGLSISTATVSHVEFMVFGSLIVWFLIVEPHGLAKLWSVGKQKLRLWPFPH